MSQYPPQQRWPPQYDPEPQWPYPPQPLNIGKYIMLGCIGLTVLLAFIVTIAVMVSSSTSSTATSDTTSQVMQAIQQQASQPTLAPTPTPTATPRLAVWTTTQTFSGNSTLKTAVFPVPDDWKLVWKCDPASFSFPYNVIVDVVNISGSPFDPGAINTLCQAGNTSGQTEEHQSGQVYLDINSQAAWTVVIQVLK